MGLLIFKKALTNIAGIHDNGLLCLNILIFYRIHLQDILIISPKKRRHFLAIIVSIEPISLNFDLMLILVIMPSLTSTYLVCKIRRRHYI